MYYKGASQLLLQVRLSLALLLLVLLLLLLLPLRLLGGLRLGLQHTRACVCGGDLGCGSVG